MAVAASARDKPQRRLHHHGPRDPLARPARQREHQHGHRVVLPPRRQEHALVRNGERAEERERRLVGTPLCARMAAVVHVPLRGTVPCDRDHCRTHRALAAGDPSEAAALLRAVQHGNLDRILPPRAPLDILAQQIVAACGAEDWKSDDLFACFRGASPFFIADVATIAVLIAFPQIVLFLPNLLG